MERISGIVQELSTDHNLKDTQRIEDLQVITITHVDFGPGAHVQEHHTSKYYISVHIDISTEVTSPIHYTTTLEVSGTETIKEYDLIVHIIYIILTKTRGGNLAT